MFFGQHPLTEAGIKEGIKEGSLHRDSPRVFAFGDAGDGTSRHAFDHKIN